MSGLNVFFSYSHQDEDLRDELEVHLSLLKRQGEIHAWHDRRITAGKEWEGAIDENLERADVILLLVSPSFIASDYCWDKEVGRAMERHAAGEALVIPIVLRPVDWHGAPFGKLQGLPKNVQPITTWTNRDEAFYDVAKGLRAAMEAWQKGRQASPPPPVSSPSPAPALPTSPPGLDLRTLREQGLLHELASVFDTEAAAVGLLERAGVPRTRLRPFGATTPVQYWESVCRELEKGLIPGGLATLLREAANDYPHNPKFQHGLSLTAGAPAAGSAAVLARWQEQLKHLLMEEAITSDALQKFTIKKQIEEARKKIRELGG